MKKLLTFIVGTAIGLGAYAQDFDSDGLIYSVLSPDDKTCAVTGMGDVDKPSITSLTIPPTVYYEGEEYTVIEIATHACQWLENMQELNLPETIKTIGYESFSGCYNLTSLTIPNSVETIESWAFEYSYKLNTVVLGESVSQIGHKPFSQAPLVAVTALGTTPPTLNSDYNSIFPANAVIGVPEESVDAYKEAWHNGNIYAYLPANSLAFTQDYYNINPGESVQLEYTVDPENAPVGFACPTVGVTISDTGLVTVSPFAENFYTTITAGTLNGLTATCGLNVAALPRFNFNGLDYMVYPGDDKEVILCGGYDIPANLVIPSIVENEGEIYTVAYIQEGAFNWNSSLEELTIPASIKYIGKYSLQNCHNLTKITIEDSNEPLELGEDCFNYCNNLTTFYIGRNLTGNTIWAYDGSINRVILGATVTEVPNRCFLGYGNNVTLVESYNLVPPAILGECFNYDRNQVKVIVPEESLEAYKEAWGEWFSSIAEAKDVTELRFENDEATIYAGEQIKLPLIVEPADATIIWSSSNSNLIRVDNEGTVYVNDLNGSGEATITATSLNGLSAECHVTLVKWFDLPESSIIMNLGETKQLEIIKTEKFEALDTPVEWIIDYGSECVSIDQETSTLTATGYGHALVYAQAVIENDGLSYLVRSFLNVDVVESLTSLTPEYQEITVYKDTSAAIALTYEPEGEYVDKTINWTAENPEIAEVHSGWNGDYYVYGLKPGTTTIVGETLNGLKVEVLVKVIGQIESLIFNTNQIYVAPERTFQLEYTTVPEETGQTIRFESENEEVATVDPESGLVTGVNFGNTYIYAYAENGWSWSVPVQVCQFPESVTFVGSSDYEGTLTYWTYFNLEFTPNDPNVCKHIDWTADDPSIVNIDSNDNSFIGRSFGTTAFRGVSVNGDVLEGTIKIAGIQIIVDGEPTSNKEVDLNSEFKLDINASSEELLQNVTFTTSNPDVATVSEDGTVTTVGTGKATIYAESWIGGEEDGKVTYSARINVTVRPSEGIILDKKEVILSPNRNADLSIIRAENESWGEITWKSSDENVVRIDWSNPYDARISYVGPGTATITARSENGSVATCEVRCIANIENLIFNTNKIYVAPEGTFQLEYTIVPEEAQQTILFESGDESVATVDPETGLVTGVNFGYTYIYAFAENGWYWTVPVQVCNLPESVKLVGSPDYEGAVNQWTYFDIEFTPNDDDICKEIQWTVDDPEIVYFDNSANAFYGQKLGKTTFKGIAANGDVLEGTITIDGIQILVNGELSRWNDVSLGTELKLDVEASSEDLLENITFSSYNTDVVTVTEDGIATAVGTGSTWVNAESRVYIDEYNYKSYYYEIQITVRPDEGIAFSNSKVTLMPGNWDYISILRADNVDWSNVEWESSDDNIVAINWSSNNQAELRYIGPGEATVTATDAYGNVAVCEVTCYGIVITPAEVEMYTDSTFQLEVKVYPATAWTERIEWTSQDPEFVSVDENGLLTTNDVIGLTRIYASTMIDGWCYVEAACDVRVSEYVPVSEITLNKTIISAVEGDEIQLIATVNPEDATNPALYWKSSNESIATVDENGLVTIHSVGSAIITVYAVDDMSIFATCFIYGTSGVEGILTEGAEFDIYNMNGILVKKNATAEDYNQLERGIYLIKIGEKVIKMQH